MPTLTRWTIKTAMLSFIAAMIVGILLALSPLLPLPPLTANLTPVFFHLIMVGWVTQMIFGVVYWLFPTASRERPRGSELLGWASYALLNLGLLLRVFIEPIINSQPGKWPGWLLVLSAALQWLAGLLFVINSWPRVRGRKRRAQT